jgi:hypothetical protein
MSEDAKKWTCEEFQAQLPDLIGTGENVADHPHLRDCELCTALLADLQTIADAARQLFPVEEPSDELWEQIESKIKSQADEADAPVPIPQPK